MLKIDFEDGIGIGTSLNLLKIDLNEIFQSSKKPPDKNAKLRIVFPKEKEVTIVACEFIGKSENDILYRIAQKIGLYAISVYSDETRIQCIIFDEKERGKKLAFWSF